jgi:hypothetical protein
MLPRYGRKIANVFRFFQNRKAFLTPLTTRGTAAAVKLLRHAAVAALVLAYIWTFRLPVTQLDDAFISYRYALNLATGHGLVFNPGEYVEGFTNLLWTLLIAAGIALGGEAEALGHWLSVVFGAASLVACYLYALALLPRRAAAWALLAPLGLFCANSFVAWTTSGLETPLYLFLTTMAALTLLQGHRFACAGLCVLALMTRPDGALLAACLLGTDAVTALATGQRTSWRTRLKDAAGPCMVFAAGLLALTLFRLWYYGDPLPNTFYAKVGGIPVSAGILYLRNFLVDGPALLVPGCVLAACSLPRFRPAAIFIIVNAIYVVAIGGDVFALGRFLLPALPLMLGGAIAGGARARDRRRAAGGMLLALVPAGMAVSLYAIAPLRWGPPDYDFRLSPTVFPHSAKREAARIHWIFSPDEDAQKHVQLAAIRQVRPPVRSMALIGIGKLGYWGPEFTIIDMVGLADRHIAHSGKVVAGTYIAPGHSRTDSTYVLSRKPDLIELPKRGTPFLPLPVLLDMWNNPALDQNYHYVPQIGAYVRN